MGAGRTTYRPDVRTGSCWPDWCFLPTALLGQRGRSADSVSLLCVPFSFSFCMCPAYPTALSTASPQAGYIGLFTGASLFSIMVVPLLQLLRRRDRRESLAVRPLDTLYSPYHNVRASRVTPGVMGNLAAAFGSKGEGGGAGAGPATPGSLP